MDQRFSFNRIAPFYEPSTAAACELELAALGLPSPHAQWLAEVDEAALDFTKRGDADDDNVA